MLGRTPDPRPGPGPPLPPEPPLAPCTVAVLGGAPSLAAGARFAADTDSDPREQLGPTSSAPNASTLGRLPARLDGAALGDAVGAWLTRYAADPVDEPGDTLVRPAVDGVQGEDPAPTAQPSTCPAAALDACQTVIAQRQIPANAGELTVQRRHQHHRETGNRPPVPHQ